MASNVEDRNLSVVVAILASAFGYRAQSRVEGLRALTFSSIRSPLYPVEDLAMLHLRLPMDFQT